MPLASEPLTFMSRKKLSLETAYIALTGKTNARGGKITLLFYAFPLTNP